MTLDQLRRRVSEIDAQLVDLIAERQRASREIADVKRATGQPTRDYQREREVILAARERAELRGVAPQVAETLMRLLIRSSLATQEQASVAAGNAGSGRRALVVGAAGKMGRWFADFLLSQGFEVDSSDPAGAPPGTRPIGDYRDSPLDHDFIVVAVPLSSTDTVLRELAMRRPRGVVFDIGSLKSPLRGGLMALKSHGVRVTSLHPMFGPDTDLLSGRHVIFVDLGSPEALEQARALFKPTMVEQVVMGLDEHDRLIAYVLGLSHALNIAFFTALASSGEAAPRLAHLSSTTFDAQLEVASKVAQESPDLYFEIQSLNDYGAESLEALAQAVEKIRAAVLGRRREDFRALMQRGLEYLQDRRSAGGPPA
ncbi:MAG: bifunctional chorismate mutase/prephenate dehydrogenase [Steroidobacteraceae bacterium]|nr:bifunctional chorismate mutase/prephenate dehydrogenase [Steroidobacteraceae bacterium]MDW8258786.1 bifunctional chorismate mutase/prephenate dehydrogenase [Gammaproteobacteria bacterium]